MDNRIKYNIGTDCCTKPCDFNEFLVFDKNKMQQHQLKKKLCCLLSDKSIESLTFPHLFPDEKGSFDEEREIDLTWKEYCKVRLFSADLRFTPSSSYIFYLQHLGD